ncbi:MAG TPA: chaperonin GroEL [Candidatus Binataceae bacterium]|nr:chaperonin GroEL [Candidatus Binataceae bacterium]
MPKLILYQDEARIALGRGVDKLTRAVRGTLGPKGGNTIIDRTIGPPIISRDGVSIAEEIELEDPFENVGAQVVREVARKTSETAGDGTTTATVLANAILQRGLEALVRKANPVDLVRGIESAAEAVIAALQRAARPIANDNELEAVAAIAAGEEFTGSLVAQAIRKVGVTGVITTEIGQALLSTLEAVEGIAFDRGFLSHYMATNPEKTLATLDKPYLLMTNQRIDSLEQIVQIVEAVKVARGSLLIIAEDISGEVVAALLTASTPDTPIVAIHPPEYGKWRQATLEDLAIMTGGRVIARETGGRLEAVRIDDLGRAANAIISAQRTVIAGGAGDLAQIAARRELVGRQLADASEQPAELDKLKERLAKLCGGTAVIRVGGASLSEQRRRSQLIENAINAARAALEDGILPGGATGLLRAAPKLQDLIDSSSGDVKEGVRILQRAMAEPLRCIAENCGVDPDETEQRVAKAAQEIGFNAHTGTFENLIASGVIDPVRTCCTALRSATSVAGLLLMTNTVIVTRPDFIDATAGAARGGGMEDIINEP